MSRVVDAILVEDQRASERTDLEQAMPVGRVARQTGDLEPHHDARAPQAHFGDETLKAFAIGRGCTRLPEVAVDHDDPLERPSECDGALPEGVLPLGALLVLEDLTQRRLPHVEVRVALQMPGFDLGVGLMDHGLTSGVIGRAIAASTSITSRCALGGMGTTSPTAGRADATVGVTAAQADIQAAMPFWIRMPRPCRLAPCREDSVAARRSCS